MNLTKKDKLMIDGRVYEIQRVDFKTKTIVLWSIDGEPKVTEIPLYYMRPAFFKMLGLRWVFEN